ncbi:MAG: YdcF family protein [Acidobacteriota bacterium]
MQKLGNWLSRACCIFALGFFLLTCTPLESWWLSLLESAWPADIPPVLLVLGAEEQAPGLVGYSTYLRLNYAVRFWRQGKVRVLIVSGGPQDRSSGIPLARSMRDYLLGHGIPASAILVEERSRSTLDNFTGSRPLMEGLEGQKGFLTSDFHSGRAARVSARLGLHWRAVPIPDARKRWNNWAQRWPLALDLARESAKWIWYAGHSWI